MDRPHGLVRLAGHDRAAVDGLGIPAVERRPDARERERLAVLAADPHRLFSMVVDAPLVEPVGGDQAAAAEERLPIRRLGLERLGACIDQRSRSLLRPAPGKQAPAQPTQLATLAVRRDRKSTRLNSSHTVTSY